MKTPKTISTTMPVIVATCFILLAVLPILLLTTLSYGQSQVAETSDSEFKTHPNGLIYSNHTITQLKAIVDSLNLKHKVCELHKEYRAMSQARGHYTSLAKGDIKAAKADLEQNISFEGFLRKYRPANISQDLLVAKDRSKDYEGNETIEFFSLPLNGKGEHTISISADSFQEKKPLKENWVVNYRPKTRYSEESIAAFYFPEEFNAPPLPKQYARMVQYADCLIDTTAQIYVETVWGRNGNQGKTPAAIENFIRYVHQETGKPEYDEKQGEAFSAKHSQWYHHTRKTMVQDDLSKRKEFMDLLTKALSVALIEGGYDNEFEEYVGLYISRKAELDLKRKRRVIGSCSQDTAPRAHAVAIAKLSAETVNWETFLRAHLDIMNDRFDRVSDGNYAWAGRKTYIKELEVVDINVADLLLGISLRLENSGENHYYGNIGRIGRALTEAQNAPSLENQILAMIQDKQLDTYNRILLYYLFKHYNINLEDKNRQKANLKRLNEAVQHLPAYLAAKATVKD